MNNEVFKDISKTVDIEEDSFRVEPFPAFRGLVVLKKLTKLIGPSVASLFTGEDIGVTVETGAGDLDIANIESAVSLLVKNFDGDGVESLIKELIATVTKNGKEINFDLEFRADYGKLLKLVAEVIKVNYGTVFQLGGLLQG